MQRQPQLPKSPPRNPRVPLQADQPRIGPLALAAGTALCLMLGSGFAPEGSSGALAPLGALAVRPAHAEATTLKGTPMASRAADLTAPSVRDAVPLQRNIDPLTMQLPDAPPDLTPEVGGG